jgi:hypothetical protein
MLIRAITVTVQLRRAPAEKTTARAHVKCGYLEDSRRRLGVLQALHDGRKLLLVVYVRLVLARSRRQHPSCALQVFSR